MTDSLWQRVQVNREALDGCALHHFSVTEVRIGQKLTCERCGGEMSLTDIGNYIRGYESAGKAAQDIWPAWKRRPRADGASQNE